MPRGSWVDFVAESALWTLLPRSYHGRQMRVSSRWSGFGVVTCLTVTSVWNRRLSRPPLPSHRRCQMYCPSSSMPQEAILCDALLTLLVVTCDLSVI